MYNKYLALLYRTRYIGSMKQTIKLTIDQNGNILAQAPKGTSPEAIAKAKNDYYAQAKKMAAERKSAMEAFDKEFLGAK